MRRDLEREVAGRRIEQVRVTRRAALSPLTNGSAPNVLRIWQARVGQGDPAEQLPLRLEERAISSVGRRGKYLLLNLDSDEVLMIHLGMTGHLSLNGPDADPEKHLFLTLALDDG